MSGINTILDRAFDGGRKPRSPEYKAGDRAYLERHLYGIRVPMPYALGTAQSDAFLAGIEAGRTLAKEVVA